MAFDEIRINNLSKSYGKNLALKKISTQFNKGKVYAVLGHNGAGKTTLMKEIIGLYKENKSIVYLGSGQSIDYPKYEMSFSPEQYALMDDLSALEYLIFVAKLYKKHNDVTEKYMYKLLRAFNLYENRNKFIFTMSNGMKRKVGHIAAMMLQTDFVFLDEPFSALDPISIYKLKKMITENPHNQGYILCTHQLDVVENLAVDNEKFEIIILNRGELIFQGNSNLLLTSTNQKTIEDAYMYYHGNKTG